MDGKMGDGMFLPIVARPPHRSIPKRRKGTESVVMPGAISRITMTLSGFAGISLLAMVAEIDRKSVV